MNKVHDFIMDFNMYSVTVFELHYDWIRNVMVR